jgi:cyclase
VSHPGVTNPGVPTRSFGSALPGLGRCLLAAMLCMLFHPTTTHAQSEPITITATPLRDSLTLLRGTSGGNMVVLAGTRGLLLVDAQYARARDSVWAALRAIAPTEMPRYLIDTHWHRDHAEGNTNFGDSVVIVAHAATRHRLETPQVLFQRNIPPLPERALPTVVLQDSLHLYFDGQHVSLLHLGPAHTDGDVVVLCEPARVAIVGDLVLPGRFPFVDLEHGGDVMGFLHAVDQLLNRLDDRWLVVPGHGAPCGMKELRAYHDMLAKSIHTVQSGIARRQTLQAIELRGLSPDVARFAWQANPESLWVATVYRSLREKH